MGSNNQHTCTICSKEFSSGERISVNEDLLQLFTFLVCKLNTTTLENTLICEACSGNIQKACEFKLLFLKTVDQAASRIRKETKPDLLKCQICEKGIKKSPSVTYDTKSRFIIDYYLSGGLNIEANRSCDSCKESFLNLHSVTILLYNFEIDPNNEDLRVPVESMNKENKSKNAEEPSEKVKIENDSSTAYENFLLKNEEINIKMEEYEENLSDEEASKNSNEDNDVLQCGDIQRTNNQLCEYQNKNTLTCDKSEIYRCDVCKFKTKNEIIFHERKLSHKNIDENKFLTCDTCEFKPKHKENLTTHMLVHKNVDETEMFKCDVCGYKTKIKGNLKKHIKLMHKNVDEIEMFKCDICEFKTKHKESLKRHMLVHKNVDEIEMFECAICEFKTKHKRNLITHMLIHKNVDEIKMFECDICGYKAKQKVHIKSHMLIHKNVDEIEMFECDICGYKAKRKVNLKKHLLTHSGKVDSQESETFISNIC